MNEQKTLWGVWWKEGADWARDARGKRFVSGSLEKVRGYQAEWRREQMGMTFYVYAVGDDGQPQPAVPTADEPKEKTLWGLRVSDGNCDKWYLDYFGRPCFSYDPRLVAAHADARKSSETWTFSVERVGVDGTPASDLLEPAADALLTTDDGAPASDLLEPAADALLTTDDGAHPGCTEINELNGKGLPGPRGIDNTGARE